MLTSSGFPWTTGRVVISRPTPLGSAEVFTLTGLDARSNGVGTLSLVSGSLADRTINGPEANRGWMRLVLPEPSGSLSCAAALAGLLSLHALLRRRSGR